MPTSDGFLILARLSAQETRCANAN